jgi:hypothetical protein
VTLGEHRCRTPWRGGAPTVARRVDADPRLNPGTREAGAPRSSCGLEPDSGHPTVRDQRGALGTIGYGGTRNPLSITERAEIGHSPPAVLCVQFLSRSPRGGCPLAGGCRGNLVVPVWPVLRASPVVAWPCCRRWACAGIRSLRRSLARVCRLGEPAGPGVGSCAWRVITSRAHPCGLQRGDRISSGLAQAGAERGLIAEIGGVQGADMLRQMDAVSRGEPSDQGATRA